MIAAAISRASTALSDAELDPDKFIMVSVSFCPNSLRAARIFSVRSFSIVGEICGSGLAVVSVRQYCRTLSVLPSFDSPSYSLPHPIQLVFSGSHLRVSASQREKSRSGSGGVEQREPGALLGTLQKRLKPREMSGNFFPVIGGGVHFCSSFCTIAGRRYRQGTA